MLLRVALSTDTNRIVSVGGDIGSKAATLGAAKFIQILKDVPDDLKLFDYGVQVVLHACIVSDLGGEVKRFSGLLLGSKDARPSRTCRR